MCSFWGFRLEESQMASAPPPPRNPGAEFCSSPETMGLPSSSARWDISHEDVPAPHSYRCTVTGWKNLWRHSCFPPPIPGRFTFIWVLEQVGVWKQLRAGGTSGRRCLYLGPNCMSGTEAGALCQWLGVFYFIFHQAMSGGSWFALGDREDVSKI